MISVHEGIVVEGIYDKIKLESFIDGIIVTTNGFRIFKDKNAMNMLRRLAETRGLVVLTDSDRAGFLIRNHIKECIPKQFVKHAYIPEIKGKEKRKSRIGKEGLLGVEGVHREHIISALKTAGCFLQINEKCSDRLKDTNISGRKVTKHDFYIDGLSGKPGSASLREALKQRLSLPSRLSTNSLLDIINTLYNYKEYKELINIIKKEL